MRRITQFLLIAAVLLSCSTAWAQKLSDDPYYLTAEDVPNAVIWMPAPPVPGSTQYLADIAQYYWGKEQRLDPQRARDAVLHATADIAPMAELFSPAWKYPSRQRRLIPLQTHRPRLGYGADTHRDKPRCAG